MSTGVWLAAAAVVSEEPPSVSPKAFTAALRGRALLGR